MPPETDLTPFLEGPTYLFDGACVLCSGTVQFVLRVEAAPRMRFAAVQSDSGQALLAQICLPGLTDSFVFIENGRVFLRSEAAFRLAAHLRAPWRWGRFLRVLPRGLTDWLYDRIAANRYAWFGRKAVCLIPAPEERHRFAP